MWWLINKIATAIYKLVRKGSDENPKSGNPPLRTIRR
jgi:hypothetical protein